MQQGSTSSPVLERLRLKRERKKRAEAVGGSSDSSATKPRRLKDRLLVAKEKAKERKQKQTNTTGHKEMSAAELKDQGNAALSGRMLDARVLTSTDHHSSFDCTAGRHSDAIECYTKVSNTRTT
jgi:hypothetical protein